MKHLIIIPILSQPRGAVIQRQVAQFTIDIPDALLLVIALATAAVAAVTVSVGRSVVETWRAARWWAGWWAWGLVWRRWVGLVY